MSERCELSDLPVEQCACRLHAPEENDTLTKPFVFIARYDGECPECHEEIRGGVSLIAHSIVSGYVHEECL